MTHSHPLLLFLLLSLTASARVQTRNFHDAGACASFRRGESVGSSVDLDHDPYDEHLVASPGADTGGKTDNGLTKALSDSTRAVPQQRAADGSLDRFGWALAFAGDVDGDGVRDVILGAPFAVNASNVATCMARVLSGASGVVLRTFYGPAAGDRFGWSVDGGFDSNNDNVGDRIVGAPEGDTTTLGDRGYVSTFSGASGSLLLRVLGTTNGARLGTAPDFRSSPAASILGTRGSSSPASRGASSSFLCVKAPTQRCVAQSTAGTAGSCNGFLVFDWLAWRAADPTALGGPLNAGELVQAQGWYRDPPSAKTTQLTNAIEFLVAP